MKQKIISLCVTILIAIAQSYGGVTLTVPEVNVAPGGTSSVVIDFDFGTPLYTAYQFDIAYPEGISSVSDTDGNPVFIKGDVYNTDHNASSLYTANGLDRFQCFSLDSKPFTAQSGTLLILPIKALKTLAEGTYQATISPIEFVQTDATPDRPNAISFNIKVSKSIVLDELSTVAPPTGTGVDVTVKRTIKANEWSTICLPFAMTEEQVKATFGNDVQLGDFKGTDSNIDSNDNVTGITVKFEEATTIEANHPYIMKVSVPITEFDLEGVDVIAKEAEAYIEFDNGKSGTRRVVYSGFYGTYHAGTVLNEYTLFLNNNKFWYSTGKTKMKAFRAYFEFYDILTEVENASSRISIIYEGTTGVKEIINSISVNGSYYDLQGRCVSVGAGSVPARKGLYLKDGKKIVNK